MAASKFRSMTRPAGPTPGDFALATWADILPYYQTLAERPLDSTTVESWLADWSALDSAITEAASLAMIAYTCDTTDPDKEAANLRFSSAILPRLDEQAVRLAARLLDLGYARPDLEQMLARFRTQREVFRESNIPLFSEIEELGSAYQKITGSLTVMWDGEEKTIPQLQPFQQSTDRATRERAFRLAAEAYAARREELATLFDELYELRTTVAANAGFADFQAYSFKAKFRFDYTPDDCKRFHEAVESVVSPAVERLMARRKARLGVPVLKPWDTTVDPDGREPLKPFSEMNDLITKCARIFDAVSPMLAREFHTMVDEGLLDLATRKGKAPGGYCETLHFRGRPFIFMNAVRRCRLS
jgi:oligoendopeptidase F